MRIGITPSSFAVKNKAPLKRLIKAGVEVVENPYKRRLTEDEAFDFLKDLDGLIAGLEPLTEKVLCNASNLKAIARVGIGMDNIDFNATKNCGIKVSNTPDGPTDSVAEMTLTALLVLLRKVIPLNEAIHEKSWFKSIGSSIKGKKILIIGFGRIGQRSANLFKTLGAEIIVFDPFYSEENANFTFYENLEKALSKTDVISFHASGRTPIITEESLKYIKKGTILLNSARGELVDEDVVVKALDSGVISAAWFDAFWEEPYSGKLCDYSNVLLTPHSGTYTEECRLSMEMDAVDNILNDLEMNL